MAAATRPRTRDGSLTPLLLLLLAAPFGAEAGAESGPAYFAVDRDAAEVVRLDAALQIESSFATTAPLPAGIARDGERIYTLHPASQEVIAYDLAGSELFRWIGAAADAAGMAMAGPHELAIRRPGAIEVHRPTTGALVRTVAVDPACGSHGLAFDGAAFWVTCGAKLRRLSGTGIGPGLGSSGTIDSPTAGCLEGGTALTAGDLEHLTVACSSGAWFVLSTTDGTVIASSNNFVDHYGLAARFEGTPVAYVAGGWQASSRRLFLLDDGLVTLASFPSTGSNAIAVDGRRVYAVRWDGNSPSTVTGYDFTGTPLSSWDASSRVTGATMVGSELALTRRGSPIDFHDPQSGAALRSLAAPPSCTAAEALSYDGELLWLLCENFLVGVDPQSGIELDAVPNPATECFVHGTGLTNPAPQRLLIACAEGDWFLISSLDGSVVESGSIGVTPYGIKAVRERQSGDCRGVDLLVSQGMASGGSEDFYAGGQWPELSAALDRSARSVSTAPDLEDLGHMLQFDALWLDQRGDDAGGMGLLTATEAQNLAAFLDTGRRLVLVGGDDDYLIWNQQILGLVDGVYSGESSASPTPIVSHPLVDGVTSLALPTVGNAAGGTPLFDSAFATLWRGAALTLLASAGAGSEYWPGGDNETFFTNTSRWIACAPSDLLLYDGFESGDTSGWTAAVP